MVAEVDHYQVNSLGDCSNTDRQAGENNPAQIRRTSYDDIRKSKDRIKEDAYRFIILFHILDRYDNIPYLIRKQRRH